MADTISIPITERLEDALIWSRDLDELTDEIRKIIEDLKIEIGAAKNEHNKDV